MLQEFYDKGKEKKKSKSSGQISTVLTTKSLI